MFSPHARFWYLYAALLASPLAGQAQTFRPANGGLWSDPANWGGTLPANDGTANVDFAAPGNFLYQKGYSTMDANWNLRAITWNTGALGDGVCYLEIPLSTQRTTLTLQAGFTNNSGGRIEIKPDLTVAADQTWSAPGGQVVVNGNLITAVPEPSSMAWLAVGILGLLGLRRPRGHQV